MNEKIQKRALLTRSCLSCQQSNKTCY